MILLGNPSLLVIQALANLHNPCALSVVTVRTQVLPYCPNKLWLGPIVNAPSSSLGASGTAEVRKFCIGTSGCCGGCRAVGLCFVALRLTQPPSQPLRRALRLLARPGDVIELRKYRNSTVSSSFGLNKSDAALIVRGLVPSANVQPIGRSEA